MKSVMKKPERQPKHFIESLARGMKVLQAFSAERPRLTLQQLADLTGLNKVAVQRLTDTLMILGYLGRNRHKEFFLEPRILTLGFAYLHGSELRQLAETHVAEFGRRLDQTVNMGVLDGTEVVILFRYEVSRFYQFRLQEGSRLPAHCTSMGKLLLASLDQDELTARLKAMTLAPLTSWTITDTKALKKELTLVRARGFSISSRESSLALYAAAAPLVDREGRVVAAVNISLPIEQARGEELADLVRALLAEGRRCSILLGYQGPYPWPGATLNLKHLAA